MWKIFTWVKNIFTGVVSFFKDFFNRVGDILIKEGAALILDVAKEAVEKMSKTDLTNEEKRKGAFDYIKDYAKDRSLTISSSIINTMIELCVQELKNRIE